MTQLCVCAAVFRDFLLLLWKFLNSHSFVGYPRSFPSAVGWRSKKNEKSFQEIVLVTTLGEVRLPKPSPTHACEYLRSSIFCSKDMTVFLKCRSPIFLLRKTDCLSSTGRQTETRAQHRSFQNTKEAAGSVSWIRKLTLAFSTSLERDWLNISAQS